MPDDPVVVLVGTLDTKGHKLGCMGDPVREAGAEVLLVDVGVLGEPQVRADVCRDSGNSSIVASAMRDLPVGVPKLIVSTVASGDTRPYVRGVCAPRPKGAAFGDCAMLGGSDGP
jgi:uncharacterized protein (UPF0261 family)